MAEIDLSRPVPLYGPEPKPTGLRPQEAPPVDLSRPLALKDVPRPAEPQADYGKAIGSGVQKGVLSVPGMVGDIQEAISYIPEVAARGAVWAREKLGVPFSEEAKKATLENVAKSGKFMREDLPKFNVLNLASQAVGGPEITTPTTERLATAAEPYAKEIFGVGPQYKPKTPGEKIAKSAVELGIPSAVGPKAGAVQRLVSGTVGGGASEVAGQQAEGSSLELPARLAGAVVGGMTADQLSNFLKLGAGSLARPGATAEKRLGETLQDYAADVGPTAQRLSRAPDIKKAADDMIPRMRDFTQRITGIDQRAPQFADLMEEFGKTERKRVYDVARAQPAAQAISHPGLDALEQLEVWKQAHRSAIKNTDGVPEWNVRPPERVGATPSTPTGLVDASGQPIMRPGQPASYTAGNLNYYDQMKRELDSIIEQAARTGDTTLKTSATNARQKLLDIIDPIVPQYKEARGVAADTFKAATAPEAGARFLALSNDYTINEFQKAFNTFTPEQKKGFAVGLMGAIEKELATKDSKLLVNRFLNNKQFMDKLDFALGPEAAGQVRAKVLSENIVQQASKLADAAASSAAMQGAASPYLTAAKQAAGTAGIAGAAFEYQAILGLLQQVGINPTVALGMLAYTGAQTGKAFVMSRLEQRVANRMVDLIKNNDPKSYSTLNSIINKHPQVYQKLIGPLVLLNEMQPGESAAPRASGGRVGYKAGGSVGMDHKAEALKLIARVKANHKANQKATEPLLQHDDTTVAKALAIANKGI